MRAGRGRAAKHAAEIVRLHKILMSTRRVAEHFGLDKESVVRLLKKLGEPLMDGPGRTEEDRFLGRVSPEPMSGCWLWLGRIHHGYAWFRPNGKHMSHAHRFSFEHFKGPIPPGLEIDHLCRNRACVNPDHLEAVTHKVNIMRAPNSAPNRSKRGERMGAMKTREEAKRIETEGE